MVLDFFDLKVFARLFLKMKFHESTFDEYVQSVLRENFHPEIAPVIAKLPADWTAVHHLPNILFYGPAGSGKYSQALLTIQRYSPSALKYQKRTFTVFNKQTYYYALSDVHFEVDMGILGCNSKLLWHEIYGHIVDAVAARPPTPLAASARAAQSQSQIQQRKVGIVLCKNFHKTHPELLEIFYSYMQQYNNHNATTSIGLNGGILIKFIFLAEHVSFLPCSILQCCHLIRVRSLTFAAQSAAAAAAAAPVASKNLKLSLHATAAATAAAVPQQNAMVVVCDAILRQMRAAPQQLNLSYFRECIYDMLTYNLDIRECVWYILWHIVNSTSTSSSNNQILHAIIAKTFTFLQYFNNNYRPIYHIEDLLIFVVIQLHYK